MTLLVVAGATAAGCGEPSDGPGRGAVSVTPGGRAPSATPSSPSGVIDVTVTVSRGRVRTTSSTRPGSSVAARVKVRRGATVRITVTGDAAAEFHGYDRTLALRPGRDATLLPVTGIPGGRSVVRCRSRW